MASYFYTISYGDTDAGGVVYFANYLRICERSWFNYLKKRGWDLSEEERNGIYLTVKKVEADYLSPARYGTTIETITSIQSLGRASFWFLHTLRDAENGTIFTTVRNQMVAVDTTGKLHRLPRPLQKILKEAYAGSD